MRRRSTLTSTSRESRLPVAADEAWAVVASGHQGPQWYVDAAPFVLRGALDRVAGGAGRRWEPPGRSLLETGDRVGFWHVTEADHVARRLALTAEVRAPGTVTLVTDVLPGAGSPGGSVLRQRVRFRPSGPIGTAYLLADLPARAALLELTHRRVLKDLRA